MTTNELWPDALDTLNLFRLYFGRLRGHPCWQANPEYSMWLSLHFGQPRVFLKEGRSDAESKRRRRRRVALTGEYLLFFDLGEWDYIENGQSILDSVNPHERLREVACLIEAQRLTRVELISQPIRMVLHFDMGGQLEAQPPTDSEPGDAFWNLYVHDRCLTLRVDGTLDHGLSDSKEAERIHAVSTVLDLSEIL